MSLAQTAADAIVRRFEENRGSVDPLADPPRAARVRRETRAFVERHVLPRLGDLDRDPPGGVPDPDLVRAGARAGLLTLTIPRLCGGELALGTFVRGGALEVMVAVEELARGCAGVATLFGAHHLGIMPILLCGDVRLPWRLLRPVARAARSDDPILCAFAITEPDAGSDVEDEEGSRTARLSVFARRVSGGYVLSGTKRFISNGSVAGLVTVFAAVDRAQGVQSWTCLAVRRGAPGFGVGRVERKMGQRASPAAELVFDDVFVPEADRVGREAQGWQLNRMTLDASRAGVGAIALGVAQGALDAVVAACSAARAGGRPLLSVPEVRLELADLVMRVETLRSLVWRACSTFPPVHSLSATAKCVGGDVAVEVCARAVALLGDAGLAPDAGIEKRLRDARLIQIYEGTNEINRLAVAEERLGPGQGPSAGAANAGGRRSPHAAMAGARSSR